MSGALKRDWPGIDWAATSANSIRRLRGGCPAMMSTKSCAAAGALPGGCLPRRVVWKLRFGRGEYRYFTYPLPSPVGEARSLMCARLAPVLLVGTLLGLAVRYPADHEVYLAEYPARPPATDAASVALRSGRLQLPASGSVRRVGVTAAGGILLSVPDRISPQRIRADRTAAADQVDGE